MTQDERENAAELRRLDYYAGFDDGLDGVEMRENQSADYRQGYADGVADLADDAAYHDHLDKMQEWPEDYRF